jgi:tetratricopeptide (TPR) repeat protein
MNFEDLEGFLDEVDLVTKEVRDILDGKLEVESSIKQEAKRLKASEEAKKREEERKRAEEERKLKGKQGKGEKFNTYKRFCKYCFVEYEIEIETCSRCSKPTITSEQRREELLTKVEAYKQERALKADKRVRWENWKKTQAMLYRKTATNYKKWDYFVDDDSEEEKLDFVPPADDPNFQALEQDFKNRAQKRQQDLQKATELKDKGNEFFKQGKYKNALKKYEEAIEIKKDWMILYTNSALARIKIEDYDKAIEDCNRVLEYCELFEEGYQKSLDTCFKALTRRGMAKRAIKKLSEAIEDFHKALELKEDIEARGVLERCIEEQNVLDATSSQEIGIASIDSAENIIPNLQTDEQILSFIETGGCKTLFQQVYENKDREAIRVLEHIFKDEEKYTILAPLCKSVYDSRRIGAIVLLLTCEKYPQEIDILTSIFKILRTAIENKHLRDEIVMHSASTKGRKFTTMIMGFFNNLAHDSNENTVQIAEHLLPLMANLCLSFHKTAVEKHPNPGNFKSVLRYSWSSARDIILRLMKSSLKRQCISLICNLTADKKFKEVILAEREMIEIVYDTLKLSINSLEIENGLGTMVNLVTTPPAPSNDLLTKALEISTRLFEIVNTPGDIEKRTYLLLQRCLFTMPSLADTCADNTTIMKSIQTGLENEKHIDISVKIATSGAGNANFSSKLPVTKILDISSRFLTDYLKNEGSMETAGNLCLLISRIVETLPAHLSTFRSVIPTLIQIISSKLGPVRKNAAICVAKLAKEEGNREVFRECHGLEVLQSVAQYLV